MDTLSYAAYNDVVKKEGISLKSLTLTQKYMMFWLYAQPQRFEIEHSRYHKEVLSSLFWEMLDNGSLIIDAKHQVIAMDQDRTKTSYQRTLFLKISEQKRTMEQWFAYFQKTWRRKQYHLLMRSILLSMVEHNQMGMYTVLHFARRRIYFEPYDYQIKELLQDMKLGLQEENPNSHLMLFQLMEDSGIASCYFTDQEQQQMQHQQYQVRSCLCIG